jgi:hypothetical protein
MVSRIGVSVEKSAQQHLLLVGSAERWSLPGSAWFELLGGRRCIIPNKGGPLLALVLSMMEGSSFAMGCAELAR